MSSSSNASVAEGDSVTAVDYLQNQMDLEREAREAMPFDTDECTYIKGELRQNIYACLTCSDQNNTRVGVCYSCSIQCHSTHELVELFSKRNVVCDCGTTKMSKTPNGGCKLRIQATYNDNDNDTNFRPRTGSSSSLNGLRPNRTLELDAEDIPSSSNTYNQNYDGKFCSCQKLYNPLQETATMHQCFFGDVCGEDWYHEDCILGLIPEYIVNEKRRNLKETPPNNDSIEPGENLLDKLTPPETGADALSELQEKVESESDEVKQESEKIIDREEYDDDMDDDDIENAKIIGNHFPSTSKFDQFICWKCVTKFKTIFKQFTQDSQIVYKSMPHFNNIENLEKWEKLYQAQQSKNSDEPKVKRVKLENASDEVPVSLFLANGFRDRLKALEKSVDKSSDLYKFLQNNQFLYIDDPIYEPPRDDDIASSSTGSLLDLGTDALSSLPKEQAIEGLQAYDKIRSKLREFFRPFAQEGKMVTEEEVRDFFGKVQNEKN